MNQIQSPTAFVLMPFQDAFRKVYTDGIQPACARAGATCSRVDEQLFTENILLRIYDQIGKASVVIAEMTGRSANVFYEVGYAHALQKRVLLLTQRADDIPFDLAHYPHIVYGGQLDVLAEELERRVRWAITHPKDPLPVEPDRSPRVDGDLTSDEVAVLGVLKRRRNVDVLDTETLTSRARLQAEVGRLTIERLASVGLIEKRGLLFGGFRLTEKGLSALRLHESDNSDDATSDREGR